MEGWTEIENKLKTFQDNFRKSYKCINKNIVIKEDTIKKHLAVQVLNYNNIISTIREYQSKLKQPHLLIATNIYWDVRDKLSNIYNKYNIDIQLPHNYNDNIKLDIVNITLLPPP